MQHVTINRNLINSLAIDLSSLPNESLKIETCPKMLKINVYICHCSEHKRLSVIVHILYA